MDKKYILYYSKATLPFNFKTMRGKLIAIEGGDGSGKTVQKELLLKRLQLSGQPALGVDFPRRLEISGQLINEYLNGTFGSLSEVGAYPASLLYAFDRWVASRVLSTQLAGGTSVVANRYTGSNLAHQGAKITDDALRQEFFNWTEDLEFNKLGIPRPDLNLILHVPADIAYDLVGQKRDRDILSGEKRNIHETDRGYLKATEKLYLELATRPGYQIIECAPEGKLLPEDEIGEMVWAVVSKILSSSTE